MMQTELEALLSDYVGMYLEHDEIILGSPDTGMHKYFFLVEVGDPDEQFEISGGVTTNADPGWYIYTENSDGVCEVTFLGDTYQEQWDELRTIYAEQES